jgi:HNH endonuclease
MSESKHTSGYEVTSDGRVFSVLTNWRGYDRRELVQDFNADGYPRVRILINGKRVSKAVHCLVAAEYLPPRPSAGHEIRHLDGKKTNNNVANLAWELVVRIRRPRTPRTHLTRRASQRGD